MTWAIVIMIGVFIVFRAMQRGTTASMPGTFDSATASVVREGEARGEPAPTIPRRVEPFPAAPAAGPATDFRQEPAHPRSVAANPRTRAIIRSIHGKGLCSPRVQTRRVGRDA